MHRLPSLAVGRSYDLFDWPTGGPNGEFNVLTNPSHEWDLFDLYATGIVRLLAVPEPSALALVASLVIFLGGRFTRPAGGRRDDLGSP